MKVLLGKIAFLGAIIILTCSIIMVGSGRQNTYLAATINKHKLLKETRSPKVILVGGSAVAYSLDSKIIQHQLGMPVVNMGLHIGAGLKYMLEEVRLFIGSGDLVVVMPEYEHFYGDTINGDACVWRLIWYVPEGLWNLRSISQYTALLKSFRVYLADGFRTLGSECANSLGIQRGPPSIYQRSSFNDSGDFVAHLNLAPIWDGHFFTKVDERINEESFSVLERFSKYATQKGAQVVVVWPSIPETFYAARREWIQLIAAKMSKYPDVRVKGVPLDSVCPVNCFFDTMYHLGAAERRKKSLDIALFLRKHIS